MVKKGEHFVPDIVIIEEGKETNVIIKGMEFGNCISDFEYHAKNSNGDLSPTVKLMEVSVENFKPRDASDSFERLKRMFEREEAETREEETASE